MYYVYILKSLKDNKYYIGQTNDLDRRIRQHMLGKVISTKYRRPFKIVGYKIYESRSQSMWVEHELKAHGDKKKKFIDRIINERPPARRASGPEGGENI